MVQQTCCSMTVRALLPVTSRREAATMHEWRFHQTRDGQNCWWECLESSAPELIKSSQRQFSNSSACVQDTLEHGYVLPSIVSMKAHMH
jgi:hypothetical protein